MTDKKVLDLNSPAEGHKMDVSITPIESDGERRLRIFKDFVVFILAVAACSAILAYASYTVAFDGTATEGTKRWAMSIISAAVGGLLGYLLKK